MKAVYDTINNIEKEIMFDYIIVHLAFPNCSGSFMKDGLAHYYGIGLASYQNGMTTIKCLGWNEIMKQNNNTQIAVNDIRYADGVNGLGTGKIRYIVGTGCRTTISNSSSVKVGGCRDKYFKADTDNKTGAVGLQFTITLIAL